MGKKKRTKQALPERKRRTREHIIADLSVHHVEGFVLQNGFTAERVYYDYGYDLIVETFDQSGFIESGEIKLQVKATDHIDRFYRSSFDGYSWSISIKDYRCWMGEVYPVFFILFDATDNRAYWQNVQQFFKENTPRTATAKTMTLRIPKKNRLLGRTIQKIREWKADILRRIT